MFSIVDAHQRESMAGGKPQYGWLKDKLTDYVNLFPPVCQLLHSNIACCIYGQRGDYVSKSFQEMWDLYCAHEPVTGTDPRNSAAAKAHSEVARWLRLTEGQIKNPVMKWFRSYIMLKQQEVCASYNALYY